MKCKCGANLGRINGAGEPVVRTAGLVFKADSPVMVCPRCKSDVPFTPDLAKALQSRLALLFVSPEVPRR